MKGFLTTHRFEGEVREIVEQEARRLGIAIEPIELPAGGGRRLGEEELGRIELAFYPGDFTSDAGLTRTFLGAALRAPRLSWLHLPNAGVDHPVFARLLERGVRLSTSSGAAAEAIAHTALGGILALARGFPAWWEAQRRHAWEPRNLHAPPPDLRGQTAIVVGLGAIGREIARLLRALGLRVIGVRRSAATRSDPVDEIHPPVELPRLLPRAEWLVLACPLTPETRGLIDARALSLLPPAARLVNVARGEVVDEDALIASLESGRLAGAYLDVFREEPLPASSPLWDLPGVIVSPHDSSPAAGNAARQARILARNLGRWLRGEPLENEVRPGAP